MRPENVEGSNGYRVTCLKQTRTQLPGDLAHNLKVVGSNPTPATKLLNDIKRLEPDLNSRVFACAILVNALSTFDESPLKQLGVSHISEHPSVGEGFEVLETVAEGYRARRFGFWIAVPSAGLGDDPRGLGKCFRRMRVLLERGLAFEFGQDCLEDFDFGGREGDPGVLPGPAITRLDELHDGARRNARARFQTRASTLRRRQSASSAMRCSLDKVTVLCPLLILSK